MSVGCYCVEHNRWAAQPSPLRWAERRWRAVFAPGEVGHAGSEAESAPRTERPTPRRARSMSSQARPRGAETPRPFGAGVQGHAEAPPGDRPDATGGRGAEGPRGAATVPTEAASRDELGSFLGEGGGAPLVQGDTGALTAPLATALCAAASQGRLDAAMGPAAADARFSPGPDEVKAAWLATEPVSAGCSSFNATAVAIGLQPSEPFAYLGARVLRALETAPRVLLIGHPELMGLAGDLRAAMVAAGVEGARVRAMEGADGAVLRETVSQPSVAVDLVDFDPVEGLVLDRLRRLRALAGEAVAETVEPAGAEPAQGDGDWFGLGAIGRPLTPIVVRPRLARQLSLGVEPAAEGTSLGEEDLADAAEQVVEQAFGRGALGGFASDAVTSVLVRPQLLSRFTACLLEVLEEVEGDPWFEPPPWVQRSPRSPALRDVAAGRRRVLDEGATLIHERRLSTGVTSGLVLTNVERRMKLAGEMSAPGTLFLVRALQTVAGH